MAPFLHEKRSVTPMTSRARRPTSNDLAHLPIPRLNGIGWRIVLNEDRQVSTKDQIDLNGRSSTQKDGSLSTKTQPADTFTDSRCALPPFSRLLADPKQDNYDSQVDKAIVNTTANDFFDTKSKGKAVKAAADLRIEHNRRALAIKALCSIPTQGLDSDNQGYLTTLVYGDDDDYSCNSREQHTTPTQDNSQRILQPDRSSAFPRHTSESTDIDPTINSRSAKSMNERPNLVSSLNYGMDGTRISEVGLQSGIRYSANNPRLTHSELVRECEDDMSTSYELALATHDDDISAVHGGGVSDGQREWLTMDWNDQRQKDQASPSSNQGQEESQLSGQSPISDHSNTSLPGKQSIPEGVQHINIGNGSRQQSITTTAKSNTASRKRPEPSDGDSLSTKRPRLGASEIQKADEVQESSAILSSLENQGLGYAWNKDWLVEDLDDVHLAKDGSIDCLVRWKPSVVKSTALVGEALKKQLMELFERKYGANKWESWYASQATRGRRRGTKRRHRR